ncbi:hypothetical protein [Stackebrandtia nassauensis]|nr:hypothetical protein [Stackebrandtia nassauensis]
MAEAETTVHEHVAAYLASIGASQSAPAQESEKTGLKKPTGPADLKAVGERLGLNAYAAMMGSDYWAPLDDDAAVAALFVSLKSTVGQDGHRCVATIGPETDDGIQPHLEVATDGANTYLRSDGNIATEPGRTVPEFHAVHHPDGEPTIHHTHTFETRTGLEDIPVNHTRVSPNWAVDTVKRYIDTGERPDRVKWIDPSAGTFA